MTAVNKGPTFLSFNSQNRWQPSVDGQLIARNPLVSVQKDLFAKVLFVHLLEMYKVKSIFWQVPIVTGDCEDEGT